jgi:hypothetical protein
VTDTPTTSVVDITVEYEVCPHCGLDTGSYASLLAERNDLKQLLWATVGVAHALIREADSVPE